MTHPLSHRQGRLIFVAIVCLVTGFLLVALRDYGYDDPYITFRYVRNLIEGNGIVFNVGEHVLSTTTPGYALLLSVVGLVYRNIPLLGNFFSTVGLGAAAVTLYLWSLETDQPFAGWAGGILMLTFPLPISTFGSEICLYIGLLLVGLYCHLTERPVLAMVLLGIATLVRPSGVIGAGLVILHLIYKQRRFPWKPVIAYALVLLPWLIYGTLFYGSPIPVTLSAKQAQGRMAISDSFAWRAWKTLRNYLKSPFRWSYVPLGILGIWQILTRRQKWLMLLVWTACYTVSYTILDVSGYFWYYAPLVPGAVVSVAVGLDWVREQLARLPGRAWQWVVVILALATMIWPNLQGINYILTHPDTRLSIYRSVGEWMDQNLPHSASVGTLEVGIIGYYTSHRIVGFAGLLQPQVASQMDRDTTYQDSALWAVQEYHPDYIVINPQWFPSWQDTVLAPCAEIQSFAAPSYSGTLVIYECRWSKGE